MVICIRVPLLTSPVHRLVTAVLICWAIAATLPVLAEIAGPTVPTTYAFWLWLLAGDVGMFWIAASLTGWRSWLPARRPLLIASGSAYLFCWLATLPASPSVPDGQMEASARTGAFLVLASGPLAAAAVLALYVSASRIRHLVTTRDRAAVGLLLVVSVIGLLQLFLMLAWAPAVAAGRLTPELQAAIAFVTGGLSPAYYLVALAVVAGVGPFTRALDERRASRRVATLAPLWRDLTVSVPEASLTVGAISARERETWMLTDIADAMTVLAPYLHVSGEERAVARARFGDDRYETAVLATSIRNAINGRDSPPTDPGARWSVDHDQLERIARIWPLTERTS